MNAPEDGETAVCRTCGAPVTWWTGRVPGRPDLRGAWYDAEDSRGVRGASGHEHRP